MIDKLKAFLVHLLISLSVMGAFIALVLWGWYYGPLLKIQGTFDILLLLFIVDVLIGPALTFLVYKRGKKTLVFDLAVIVALQLAAFVYGATTIYTQRPVYLAQVHKRFEVVRAGDIDFAKIADATLDNRFGLRPKLIYVQYPDDPETLRSITQESAVTGFGFAFQPDFYRPFPGPIWELRTFARNTEAALKAPDAQASLGVWLERHNLKPADVLLYPVVGRLTNAALLFDVKDGTLLGMVNYDPMPIMRLEQEKDNKSLFGIFQNILK